METANGNLLVVGEQEDGWLFERAQGQNVVVRVIVYTGAARWQLRAVHGTQYAGVAVPDQHSAVLPTRKQQTPARTHTRARLQPCIRAALGIN